MTRLAFMAQQAIPFPGKLGLAGGVARRTPSAPAPGPTAWPLALEAAVRRAYADLLEARENLRLVDEQIETWRRSRRSSARGTRPGMGRQQDVLRAQSEQTRLLQQRRRDEAAEKTALVRASPAALSPARTRRFRPRRGSSPARSPAAPRATEFLAGPRRDAGAEGARPREGAREPGRRTSPAGALARLRRRRPDILNRGALPLMWSAGVGVSVPLWSAGSSGR